MSERDDLVGRPVGDDDEATPDCCVWCGKPVATDDDLERYEDGEGEHLCWRVWSNCLVEGSSAAVYDVIVALRAALAAAPGPHPEDRRADGVALIAAERRRQAEQEGWTSEHDDSPHHAEGQMALAAACYALISVDRPPRCHDQRNAAIHRGRGLPEPRLGEELWPWDKQWWKPRGRLRNLVRAGALIAAEIDRLTRAGRAAGDHPAEPERPLQRATPDDVDPFADPELRTKIEEAVANAAALAIEGHSLDTLEAFGLGHVGEAHRRWARTVVGFGDQPVAAGVQPEPDDTAVDHG